MGTITNSNIKSTSRVFAIRKHDKRVDAYVVAAQAYDGYASIGFANNPNGSLYIYVLIDNS